MNPILDKLNKSPMGALNPMNFQPNQILPRLQKVNQDYVQGINDTRTLLRKPVRTSQEDQKVVSNLPMIPLGMNVVGAAGMNAPANLPKQGSIEQITEQQGGWQPGMRQQFDTALFKKDASTVQKLLPQIPADYATRFADQIKSVLGAQVPSQTPSINPVVLKSLIPLLAGIMGIGNVQKIMRGQQL